MSAASLDPESSQSSSGYEDGLGRRVLAFDRETGEMLERLILRPELSAFEEALSTRDLIGKAQGILMARRGCDEDEAFDLLRQASVPAQGDTAATLNVIVKII